MNGKKLKCVNIIIRQKLNALELLDKGEMVQIICNELVMAKVLSINGGETESHCRITIYRLNCSTQVLCTIRKSTNEIVNDVSLDFAILWMKIVQQCQKGMPISGPILKEKMFCFHRNSKIRLNLLLVMGGYRGGKDSME